MVNVYTINGSEPRYMHLYGTTIHSLLCTFVPSTRSEDGHYCIATHAYTVWCVLMNSYEAIVDAPSPSNLPGDPRVRSQTSISPYVTRPAYRHTSTTRESAYRNANHNLSASVSPYADQHTQAETQRTPSGPGEAVSAFQMEV